MVITCEELEDGICGGDELIEYTPWGFTETCLKYEAVIGKCTLHVVKREEQVRIVTYIVHDVVW